MKRVYIAGPITGLPDLNRQAFADEFNRLAATNEYFPVNPHHVPDPKTSLTGDALWQYYMRECVKLLADCDIARFLPGWQNSRGACVEHRLALELGIECQYLPVPDHDPR